MMTNLNDALMRHQGAMCYGNEYANVKDDMSMASLTN